MVALDLRACIVLRRLLAGLAVDARMSRPRGCTCPARPIWRTPPRAVARASGIEQAVDAAHPIGALLLDGQVAAPGSVGIVGQVAVLVEQQRQPVSSRPGTALAPTPSRCAPGRPRRNSRVWQSMWLGRSSKNFSMIVQVFGPDLPARLRRGHVRQLSAAMFHRSTRRAAPIVRPA